MLEKSCKLGGCADFGDACFCVASGFFCEHSFSDVMLKVAELSAFEAPQLTFLKNLWVD